jgi:hypothetical protein
MRRYVLLGTASLLSVIAMAGCGDDDDSAEDVQEANTEVCEDLAAYGGAVGDLVALDAATATTDDYESAADAVRSAREDLVESAQDLAEEEWENLESQVDELRDQLQDPPDDEAVADILAAAQQQATTVQASVATLNTAICTPANVAATTGG